MPNPNPKRENLKPAKPVGEVALATKQLQVRVIPEVDEAVRSLGIKKAEWLRRVITDAAYKELIKRTEEDS